MNVLLILNDTADLPRKEKEEQAQEISDKRGLSTAPLARDS
jgi:hypothetical protein